MVQTERVGHPEAEALLAKARETFAAGDDKEAARLLTDAAYHTHDPEVGQQIRDLAAMGLDRAGRLAKGRWKEIIRIAELRASAA